MCIRSDISLYYRNTYVSIMVDNQRVPFYVQGVAWQNNSESGEENRGEEFLHNVGFEEIKRHLKLTGSTIDVNGEEHSCRIRSINMDDENLILDLPQLGYMKMNSGRWEWYAYRPAHSAKKGFCSERVNRPIRNIFNLFNWQQSENNPIPDLVMAGRKVYYCGMLIGGVSANTRTIKLARETAYLKPKIEDAFGGYVCQL